ncbi:hypothetical protein ACET3Z_021814 [Daucus carota]
MIQLCELWICLQKSKGRTNSAGFSLAVIFKTREGSLVLALLRVMKSRAHLKHKCNFPSRAPLSKFLKEPTLRELLNLLPRALNWFNRVDAPSLLCMTNPCSN